MTNSLLMYSRYVFVVKSILYGTAFKQNSYNIVYAIHYINACNIVNYITLMPYGHERCDGDC